MSGSTSQFAGAQPLIMQQGEESITVLCLMGNQASIYKNTKTFLGRHGRHHCVGYWSALAPEILTIFSHLAISSCKYF